MMDSRFRIGTSIHLGEIKYISQDDQTRLWQVLELSFIL